MGLGDAVEWPGQEWPAGLEPRPEPGTSPGSLLLAPEPVSVRAGWQGQREVEGPRIRECGKREQPLLGSSTARGLTPARSGWPPLAGPSLWEWLGGTGYPGTTFTPPKARPCHVHAPALSHLGSSCVLGACGLVRRGQHGGQASAARRGLSPRLLSPVLRTQAAP